MFRRYVPNQSEESINGEFRAKSIIKPASFDQSNRSNIQTNESNNKPNTLSEFNLESWLRTQVFMNVDQLQGVQWNMTIGE